MFVLKSLKKISVIGLGLLGSSVTLSVSRALSNVACIGYSHRESTRQKAREMGVVDVVCDDICESVKESDIVILATPIFTFEDIFAQIAPALKPGCIVTDVGSTKVLPHRWARNIFKDNAVYVGSHPIAGSEKRGLEYARDDLLVGANCIITEDEYTDAAAANLLGEFWSALGCYIKRMTPAVHDRIFGRVSHLPHLTAAALINATSHDDIVFAGKGFIDTTRVASGPANIWTDILLANGENSTSGIDELISELEKIKQAIKQGDEPGLAKLLDNAREKRAELIKEKLANREII